MISERSAHVTAQPCNDMHASAFAFKIGGCGGEAAPEEAASLPQSVNATMADTEAKDLLAEVVSLVDDELKVGIASVPCTRPMSRFERTARSIRREGDPKI